MLDISEKARKLLSGRPGNSGSEPECELGQELHSLHLHGFGNCEGVRVRTRVYQDESKPNSKLFGMEDDKSFDLEYELTQEEINLEKLQKIASTGIPDGGNLRATTWKLLLGYLPPSRNLWQTVLSENRSRYLKLKEDYLLSPSQLSSTEVTSTSCKHGDGQLRRLGVSKEEHPLGMGDANVWHKYFECTEIAEQIDRDLERTHPDVNFFSSDSSLSKKNKESMKNILLLFAKLNPTIRYVQGMNEVLAPIYYVFSTDPAEENAASAEADSFAGFVRLLSDSVNHFCQQLDNNSSIGIHATLSRLTAMLKVNDEKLWEHLEFTSKVNPQFYAFRWITLLLTQEFPFDNILRIWDSLISDPAGVQDMLLRVCCAMLICEKSRLMSGDFAANLYLLQHYPKVDIEHLLKVAQDIVPDTSTLRVLLE